MAKLTAWLVTILGIVLISASMGAFNVTDPVFLGILGIGVLVIGIGKLARNYSRKKK